MSASVTPPNAFINTPSPPSDADVAAALGPAKVSWDKFLADLAQDLGANIHEWKCHSPKWGWSLRVKRKARTIVWLSPCDGGFNVAFILGDRAVKALRLSEPPGAVLKALDAAQKYPEGTGVRFHVKNVRMIGALKKLAAIKQAN